MGKESRKRQRSECQQLLVIKLVLVAVPEFCGQGEDRESLCHSVMARDLAVTPDPATLTPDPWTRSHATPFCVHLTMATPWSLLLPRSLWKGLKKEREKDAGSEEAKAERVKDGEVGQVRSDVDSDAAKIRPRTEGGWNRREDVGRTCLSFFSSTIADLKATDKHCFEPFFSASGQTDILDPLPALGGLKLKSLNQLCTNCHTTRRCTCLFKNELWMDITPLTSEHQRGTDRHGWDQTQRL
ncbi:uncharacterized protein LOC116731590 [Xiphophorus hellerii]|uniref:uncharacterized protein LOC116731590 n=1 Tax=Xiphophorus hellerii TaxID=8084 RepID=UPI0013B4221D|nr:uncharacterized protein LOC116731590 [Xiphophorus hellerii]